jgi:hypothetical protein
VADCVSEVILSLKKVVQHRILLEEDRRFESCPDLSRKNHEMCIGLNLGSARNESISEKDCQIRSTFPSQVIIMGYLNRNKVTEDNSHLNWMGGKSFDIRDPILRLRIAASSCFFGEGMYYHRDAKDTRNLKVVPPQKLNQSDIEYLREVLDARDLREWRSKSPKEMMESAIDEALKKDVYETLREAIRLRTEDNIRVTPQVILVRAAHLDKGTGYVRDLAPGIIQRADEPAIGLAYHFEEFGKDTPIPNSLKKAWRDALEKSPARYLAKNQLNGRYVSTKDVIRLVHPKSKEVSSFMNGEVTNEDNTWEAIVSKYGSYRESWTKAIEVMPHMAMLRNLRNLIEHDVEPSLWIDKLIRGVPGGRQLPFRYLSAYDAIKSIAPPSVLDAVETCLEVALENVPQFPGKVMSLCDNSGSAMKTMTSSMGTMQISRIANLTGVITGKVSDNGYIGIFGDKLAVAPVRKKSSIFDQVNEADIQSRTIGQSTENGIWLFWRDAIEKEQHWDHVFVYSDMQAGHGGLYGLRPDEYRDYIWQGSMKNIDVAKLINTYRRKVNPNVNVFLCQMAGYQDTIVPEWYNRVFILGGWSAGILNFAHKMIQLNNQ